jgi:peptidyl-Lys metalloendopeptidase
MQAICILPLRRKHIFAALFCLVFAYGAARASDTPLCTGRDIASANAALRDAQTAMDNAIADIDSASEANALRLTTWFGANSSADAHAVRAVLVKARAYADGVTFLCSVSTSAALGDVYAYVRPDNSFAIVLGALYFFQAPDRGFNSKRGVIIHEMTHFVLAGATKDFVYGVDGAKTLASSSPPKARANADNYEYFVEATIFNL